ncbi:MAG: hypothetical protein KBG28_07910 [Kofleriaceae bacterium]|nr:hypothetical protein [Kofleriaceae bacterium]MBP9203869.1 hypothetical protein [Kofleriaceae bacterium]
MAVATYPGTVSPLRGLDPYTEAERDVLYGQDTARDELSRLVTADGFRAGLLYGECGVGKTSLIRAGLIPHLRDHGVVAVLCEDPTQPTQSLAVGMSALGMQPQAGENAGAFLARIVSNAVAGQQFVFVIDDADEVCQDERRVTELSELFGKVVARSGGRARFLFVAASDRMHVLGQLERRTGALFPPSARYELARFAPSEAIAVLDRVLALSGIAADPKLAEAIVVAVGRGEPVLPAEVQLAAIALRDLRIGNLAGVQKAGGGGELTAAWLAAACRGGGNERVGMRVIAELTEPDAPRTAEAVAQRLGLAAGEAQRALESLQRAGAVVELDGGWSLRHPLLASRVRELTAPARVAARRAYDLLGSKTVSRQRLSLRELWQLRVDGITPVTPEERAVVTRSRRHFQLIAGAVAAVPVVVLVAAYLANSGRAYYDLEPGPGGDRVVLRAGRAGLSAFHWMPASPGFGDVVADPGLSRAMIAPEAWKKISDHDLGGDLSGWDKRLPSIMEPQLAGLTEYATSGSEKAVEALGKAARAGTSPDPLTELLIALRPIARGTPVEIALVESALATPSPAVQRAAVAVAGAAAQRRPEIYKETLTKALTGKDPELRRIAFGAVRGLGAERARALFAAALGKDPDPSARRELLVEVSAATTDEAPSAASSVAVLSDPDATPALKDRAKGRLRRALGDNAADTQKALMELMQEERASSDARIFAIELLREAEAPTPGLDEAARGAFGSRSEAVKAAALPLYARVAPDRALADLGTLLGDSKAGKSMREAAALAWGELVKSHQAEAEAALGKLIRDPNASVRAAAATAYGKLGRVAQDPLIKMIKIEAFAVAIGAAEGLAVTADAGASVNVAVDGIGQLWKQKGKPRREAARIYARMARKRPGPVFDRLVAAARSPEDPALHPIGLEGLCDAANAGSREARAMLPRMADDPSTDVRRQLIRCVADGPEPAKNGVPVAVRLVRDPDGGIRAEAARILAMSAGGDGKPPTQVAEGLLPLVEDADRDVRLIAARALTNLGAAAPKQAGAAMARAFERADEAEKLGLLRAARNIPSAAELVAVAVADPSPLVRVEAIDAALDIPGKAASTLSSALTDSDATVRRAALERLAKHKDKLDAAALERALDLGVRDADPDLAQLALTSVARLAPKEVVLARLSQSLASRTERSRAQAAAAAIGLVEHDAALAVQLLEPLLVDPSHDVRVAMLPSLAAAYAKVIEPQQLARALRGAERNAMRRLCLTAAFLMLARTDAGKTAAEATLTKVAEGGPPLARWSARLALGLIEGRADGITFMQQLVP